MPVETALTKILDQVEPLKDITSVALSEGMGLVLAEDICSPINVPPFANSAMDGYALRIEDLENTDTLRMAGKSFAGIPYDGVCQPGECIRIMTGAQMPEGADTVIMQEETEVDDDNIRFTAKVSHGENVRPIGDDVHRGDVVVAKGNRITAREMPLLASLGIATLPVYRRPVVAFFSTGDELRPVGELWKLVRFTTATVTVSAHCWKNSAVTLWIWALFQIPLKNYVKHLIKPPPQMCW